MALRHFLLIYDLDQGHLVLAKDLGTDGDAAAREYSECEAEYRDREGFEIVLVGADSIETIKKTHSHYFESGDEQSTKFNRLLTPSP